MASVLRGHDVALHCFHGLRIGHSPGHHALEEIARGPVAVIAAGSEDDGSLLLHWLIALGKRDDAGAGEAPGLGVALIDGIGILAIVGAHVGDEGGASRHGEMAVDAVLHIEPGIGFAWMAVAHDVDGIHVASVVVAIVHFGIAKVEAALAVEMESGGDHVHAFGPAVDGRAYRGVVAIAHAGGDSDAVDLVPMHGYGESVGYRGEVVTSGTRAVRRATRRCGYEVVMVGRLVVDLGDSADRVCAKGVLCSGIGVPVAEKANVDGGFI